MSIRPLLAIMARGGEVRLQSLGLSSNPKPYKRSGFEGVLYDVDPRRVYFLVLVKDCGTT